MTLSSPSATTSPVSPTPSPIPTPDSPLMGWAAIFSAVSWPIAIIVVSLVLREKLPTVGRALLNRLTEIKFSGFSLKLAEAKSFDPKFSTPTVFDLRSKIIAAQVSSSTIPDFISQLEELDSADYAVISLGDGKEWLTSRLYIMAIVLGWMKNLKALVFIGIRKRFIGWAEPEKVRWALAKTYPHLESAYAKAYADITKTPSDSSTSIANNAVVVTRTGRLGSETVSSNSEPSIYLIQAFLECIQSSKKELPGDSGQSNADGVLIDVDTQTYEDAIFLNRISKQITKSA